MDSLVLEITLISAQNLRPLHRRKNLHCYALLWLHPSFKLRTLVDRSGGSNPSWNDKFIFRVPPAALAVDSPASLAVQIYADGGWCLPDPLVGSVRLLVGNLRLLDRRCGDSVFEPVGIRRPSGRFEGVLNVAAAVVGCVSSVARLALEKCPAIGYRDLMGRRIRVQRKEEDEDESGAVLCGPCVLRFPRKMRVLAVGRRLERSSSRRNLEQSLSESIGGFRDELTEVDV